MRNSEPFGQNLQADTVVLQHGLTTVLGILEQGLAEESATVESLKTSIELAKDEILSTLEKKKEVEAFGLSKVGGFGGEPEIDWE